MGTEKFIAFKEDGTAYRLKGRILRFLDNEPVSEADKTNIRSTLSVPASAEGLTPANNLSDLDSAATARTNLSVNSIDEDAQANALKTTAPALYFSGSSYVTVADDDRFSFTDGTDDLPFTVASWVNLKDTGAAQVVLSKYGPTNAFREYFVSVGGPTDNALMRIYSTSALGYISVFSPTSSMPLDEWAHVAFVYKGSGPNSSVSYASAFSDARQVIDIYINGVAQSGTQSNFTDFAGMTNSSQPVYIGRDTAGNYAKGSIRDCKIFNRELTSTEVAELARGNDLGFSEEWGGAHGGVYTQDATPSGEWTGVNATDADEAGPVGGLSNVMRVTANSVASVPHYVYQSVLTPGKRYRIQFKYRVPSGQSNIDGIGAYIGSSNVTTLLAAATQTLDTWNEVDVSVIATASANADRIYIYGSDGASLSFTDAGGDDYFDIAEMVITEIGTLADFRSEDYNESANKLLDRSSNNFVGVGTSVTLTGNQRHISADTIDLKNLPTSSAGLSAGEVWSNGGVLTVV